MKREIIICSFWLLLSCYLSVESYRLGLNTPNRPGPGFFPFIAAIGMALIAAFRLGNNIRHNSSDDNAEPSIAGEARLVLYVIAGMTAYAFLLDLLGFVSLFTGLGIHSLPCYCPFCLEGLSVSATLRLTA